MLLKGVLMLLLVVSSSEGTGTYWKAINHVSNLRKINLEKEMSFSALKMLNESFNFKAYLEKFIVQSLTDSAESLPVSRICLQHLNATLRAVTVYQERWALSMLDAIGKLPNGILNGNILLMGDYEECVNVTATLYDGPNRTHPTHPFKGQYCTTGIPTGPPVFVPGDVGSNTIPVNDIRLGLCVPSTCCEKDITALINYTLALIPGNSRLQANITVCQKDSLPWDTKAIAAMVFCGVLSVVVLLGTLYDMLVLHELHRYCSVSKIEDGEEVTKLLAEGNSDSSDSYGTHNKTHVQNATEPGLGARILVSFSLYTNASKLLSTRSQAGNLGCVNGIRFFSISWVILGHSYAFSLYQSRNVFPFISSQLQTWSFMAVVNATVAVDTFFLLSGLLVSYLGLKQLNRVGGVRNLNWAMFYFHRFWRLTPAYGLFIFLYVSLTRYYGNGPFWPQGGSEYKECQGWWMNLLYINNFFKPEKTCVLWSWYLANDMQFYMVSPLMLIPLYISGVYGLMSCLAFLTICLVSTGAISTIENLPMGLIEGINLPSANTQNSSDNGNNGISDYFDDYYIKPYTRIGPYVIGMLLGYWLYKTNGKKHMKLVAVLLGWLLAAICCLSVLYGNFTTISGRHMPSKHEVALYNSVHSTVWALGVAWVIYACCTGNGGFVNKLLSWSLFIPLSRLTYLVYLVHPVIMLIFTDSLRQSIYLTEFDVAYMFLGHLVLAHACAFVLTLAIEAPFIGLEKALLGQGRRH
ncbi:nose resistant to fluoxetine protein 6-like [Dreissena polymorpha]|uniref:nose resistant to fluoxetine protein 6-like n=1 Tax=Dreissena polymorpha TaxID=45954 RepID=UPI002263C902|nr:nose resistant to fluoxetine protein 6-like [Dreissena polymorpha]